MKELIIHHPREQLLSVMMNSRVTQDPTEAMYVGEIILRHLREKDIVPSVARHSGVRLASRCLISLGFFREHMEHLTREYARPSPNFYMEVGKREFRLAGKFGVSEHMEDWTDFLHETFETRDQETEKEPGKIILYQSPRFKKSYSDIRVWKRPGFLSDN